MGAVVSVTVWLEVSSLLRVSQQLNSAESWGPDAKLCVQSSVPVGAVLGSRYPRPQACQHSDIRCFCEASEQVNLGISHNLDKPHLLNTTWLDTVDLPGAYIEYSC